MTAIGCGAPGLPAAKVEEPPIEDSSKDAGSYAWHTFFGSKRDGNHAMAIAVDRSDNIYVTGWSAWPWDGPGGQGPLSAHCGSEKPRDNIFVLKLDSSGAYQWHAFFDDSGTSQGRAIAVGKGGDVYVTGHSGKAWNGPTGEHPLRGFSHGIDVFVLKLDPTGAYQWHTFYGGSEFDFSSSLAIDHAGDVYVAGTAYDDWNSPDLNSPINSYAGHSDAFVLKLDSTGAYQWHTFWGQPIQDTGQSIALQGSDSLVFVGASQVRWEGPGGEGPLAEFSNERDLFVLNLDLNGAYRWHTFFDVASSLGEFSLAVGNSGDIYVAGSYLIPWDEVDGASPLNGPDGESDEIIVVKLSSSGLYEWHTFYGGDWSDSGRSLVVGGNGAVYVTGSSEKSWRGPGGVRPLNAHSGSTDAFVLKLSNDGAYRWHTFFADGGPFRAYSIAIGSEGSLYATGTSVTLPGGPESWLVGSEENDYSHYSFVLSLNNDR